MERHIIDREHRQRLRDGHFEKQYIGEILTNTFQDREGFWTECIVVDTQRYRTMGTHHLCGLTRL